jgi:hypothetical protein
MATPRMIHTKMETGALSGCVRPSAGSNCISCRIDSCLVLLISPWGASDALLDPHRLFVVRWLALRNHVLGHPRGFLIARNSALRREMVNHPRQVLGQNVEQLVALHAGLLHEIANSTFSECRL